MPKTPAQWQADARKRLQEKGGAVVAFKATPATKRFLDSQKAIGKKVSDTLNLAVEKLSGFKQD